MSSLLLNLDDTTFQTLVDDARLSLPALAPGWTDFNTHDPGIMLIELLAWNTEAQIYSLGHVRQDERRGYAALMGVRPRGPQPAAGLVWPQLPADGQRPWAGGLALPAGTSVSAQRGQQPPFSLIGPLWLHGASLINVAAVSRSGTTYDYTQVNRRRNAQYPAFGPVPTRGDRLILGLSAFVPPAIAPVGQVCVALGFRVVNPTAIGSRSLVTARFRAMLSQGSASQDLRVREDSTFGLSQSGVLLIEWPVAALSSGAASTLVLEFISGELYPPPLVERIDVNVLRVIQQQPVQDTFNIGAAWPDLTHTLETTGWRFGDSSAALSVSVATPQAVSAWSLVETFDETGPADTVFTFEPAQGVIQFGNGINGAIPPTDSVVTASYWVTQGSAENLSGGLSWAIPQIETVFGVNLDAMTGGADADELSDLQRRARLALSQRSWVTDEDLISAAIAQTQLRVIRAEVLACDVLRPGLRQLLVVRQRGANDQGNVSAETALWREALRRALLPQLTLGQSLQVVAPTYIPIQVTASVSVTGNTDRVSIATQVLQVLQSRFALYAMQSGQTPWPLGAAVSVQSIRGWLRAIPGVLSVGNVTVTSGSTSVNGGEIALSPTGLPLLSASIADISVTRAAGGSTR